MRLLLAVILVSTTLANCTKCYPDKHMSVTQCNNDNDCIDAENCLSGAKHCTTCYPTCLCLCEHCSAAGRVCYNNFCACKDESAKLGTQSGRQHLQTASNDLGKDLARTYGIAIGIPLGSAFVFAFGYTYIHSPQ